MDIAVCWVLLNLNARGIQTVVDCAREEIEPSLVDYISKQKAEAIEQARINLPLLYVVYGHWFTFEITKRDRE
jgi:hypothetical protein